MTTGWPVLRLLLLLPLCCPSSPQQQGTVQFSQFLHLTEITRAHVQGLLLQYKDHQFGDQLYEDNTLMLYTLPSFDMDYSQWISMQDWERLSTASKNLHTFRNHLDMRRLQMEKFWKDRRGTGWQWKKAMYLIGAMSVIQRNLQDLIGRVNLQLRSLAQASSSPAPQELIQPAYLPPIQDLWTNRLVGYVILRDLERYLGKLARDFIFLTARHRGRPAAPTHANTT